MMDLYLTALADVYDVAITCTDAEQVQDEIIAVEWTKRPNFTHRTLAKAARLVMPFREQCSRTLLRDYYCAKEMVSRVRGLGPFDLIIAVDGATITAGALLAKENECNLVYVGYEYWSNPSTHLSRKVRAAQQNIEKEGIKFASHIIVPSPAWKNDMADRLQIPSGTFSVVYLCDNLCSQVDSWPEIHDPLRIHYHGNFSEFRGLESLVLAMETVDGAHLSLRGSGGIEKRLKRIATSRRLKDKVSFLPRVPSRELGATGSNFDVGITMATPSLHGGMVIGMKHFQYLNSGLAVIVPRSKPLAAFTDEFDVGLTYTEPSVAELSKVLSECSSSRDKVREWKLNARRLAETQFNLHFQAEAIRSVVGNCVLH